MPVMWTAPGWQFFFVVCDDLAVRTGQPGTAKWIPGRITGRDHRRPRLYRACTYHFIIGR